MSISGYMGLETALRALLANQEAIDTTGHNIANANTPGYSRETAMLDEATPVDVPANSNRSGAGAEIGAGVDVNTISRIRDQFLDIQYRAQNSVFNNSQTTTNILNQVQAGIDEPSANGLQSQLSAFWSAWSDLANNPTSQAARQQVINTGTTLAGTFNSLDQQMATVQSQAAQQYTTLTSSTGEVQTDASQIAQLNAQIAAAATAGNNSPNDLLDQRDNLIDDLSKLATVSVTDPGNGMLTVSFGDAANPLVQGTTVNWPQTLTAAAGGELGSLLGLSDPTTGTIQAYRTSLGAVAGQLISQVNAVQTTPPFFSGTNAQNIAVSATAAQVQTSSSGAPGGNDLAIAVAGQQGGTADGMYAAFVSQVGSDIQASQSAQTTQQAVLTSINNQRESASGVSLDEEMTNLITYQRAYQASARMMTTIDSTLDTLINHTGAVGL